MATDIIARALAVSGGGGGSDGYTKAEVDALLTKKEDDILHFKTWEDYEKVKNTIPVDTYFVIEEETGEDVYKKIEQIESEIAVQTARIDQIVGTVPPGSADEIADARVMTDGSTANNLGDAIRTQCTRLKEQIGEIYDVAFHPVPVTLNYTKGYWGNTNNHAYTYSASYYRSGNIDLPSKASIYFNDPNYQTRIIAWKFDGTSYTDVTLLHDYTDGAVDIQLSNQDWYCIGINIKRLSGGSVTSEDLANIQQGLAYIIYESNANPLREYETICENGCLCSSQGQLLFKKLSNLEQNCNFQALTIYDEHIYAFGHTSDSVGFIKKYNLNGTLLETKTQDTAFHHVIGVDSFGDGKFLVSSREGASASEDRKFYVYDFDANQILSSDDFPSVEGYTSIATNVIDSGHYMFIYSDLSTKATLKTFVYDVSENALNERADIITNYKYVQDAFLSSKIVYAHTNDGTGADGELVIFNYVTGEMLGKISEIGLGEIEGCHIQKEESYIYMYFIDNSHKRLYKAKLQ